MRTAKESSGRKRRERYLPQETEETTEETRDSANQAAAETGTIDQKINELPIIEQETVAKIGQENIPQYQQSSYNNLDAGDGIFAL